MYVLIAIVFISELIVAGFILYWICKADRCVLAQNIKITEISPQIIESVKKVRNSFCLLQKSVSTVLEFIKCKRMEFYNRVINLVVILLILNILKTKYKTATKICKYAILLKDCWDSIPG